ncbi:MAG TPA: hypothetical protein VFR55_07915 [Dehalococcoidia bacterium]|nr:hypothetical protein [Dehalococcoidia bacterium]
MQTGRDSKDIAQRSQVLIVGGGLVGVALAVDLFYDAVRNAISRALWMMGYDVAQPV